MGKLMKGDCLERLKEIPDNSVDLILTDPPYGTTACKWDSVIPFERLWPELRRVRKERAAVVMTANQPFTTVMIASNMAEFKYCWAWDKGNGTGFLNVKFEPLRVLEDVVVFYSKRPTYNAQMRDGFKPYTAKQGKTKTQNYGAQAEETVTVSDGKRFPINLLKCPRDTDKVHPTQKPVALMEYLIRTYTNEGDTVLDFTMGSGTTGVACVNTKRDFIGIELDDKYFAIAVERIKAAKEAC